VAQKRSKAGAHINIKGKRMRGGKMAIERVGER
jgi:hypothetical protein